MFAPITRGIPEPNSSDLLDTGYYNNNPVLGAPKDCSYKSQICTDVWRNYHSTMTEMLLCFRATPAAFPSRTSQHLVICTSKEQEPSHRATGPFLFSK